ncbi:hypothetical protein AAFF_G00247840 [Aldrovandia affinis]|uniref:Uncharacterized protein n=1 Tax=Aldrovandia affinis TaxID=143900 RepID=A0AAD7RDN2_9TELE|nr:hypothetical protein AAFF_G00247840 [Aldrovandia affinis]
MEQRRQAGDYRATLGLQRQLRREPPIQTGIVLVYDSTSERSFQHIMKWVSDVDERSRASGSRRDTGSIKWISALAGLRYFVPEAVLRAAVLQQRPSNCNEFKIQ